MAHSPPIAIPTTIRPPQVIAAPPPRLQLGEPIATITGVRFCWPHHCSWCLRPAGLFTDGGRIEAGLVLRPLHRGGPPLAQWLTRYLPAAAPVVPQVCPARTVTIRVPACCRPGCGCPAGGWTAHSRSAPTRSNSDTAIRLAGRIRCSLRSPACSHRSGPIYAGPNRRWRCRPTGCRPAGEPTRPAARSHPPMRSSTSSAPSR